MLRAGSYARGKTLDKPPCRSLASIPSREDTLAKLLGVMQAPVSTVLPVRSPPSPEARGRRRRRLTGLPLRTSFRHFRLSNLE